MKTNVVRLLEQAKISHSLHEYGSTITNGVEVAKALGENVSCVFKTLVCVNENKQHYVFCVPVADELDLKKAAKATSSKWIAMILQKELLPLTGYIHGGCSPIGMKKKFPTYIDQSAQSKNTIFVSGGKIGLQVQVNPLDLAAYTNAIFIDLKK